MQWDTHYGSSILKPKPETSLFFGGIKWLTTVLFRFFVENYCSEKPSASAHRKDL